MTLRMPVTRFNAYQRACNQLRLARRSLMDARLPPEIEDATLARLTALMSDLSALDPLPETPEVVAATKGLSSEEHVAGSTVNEVPTLEGVG